MALVLHPTIHQDAASPSHEGLPQSRHGNLIEEWWPSVWGPIKLPSLLYGAVDHGTVHAQSIREASAPFEACNDVSRVFKPDVDFRIDIVSDDADYATNTRPADHYHNMRESNVGPLEQVFVPHQQVFVPLLNACSGMETIGDGQWVHIAQKGMKSDLYNCCSLVDIQVKCGDPERAHNGFESLPTKLVQEWNAFISHYAHNQKGYEGLKLFKQMQEEGVKPSRVTFLCVLKACSNAGDLDEGRQIHACLLESGLEFAMFVENALIDMYVKCGSLDEARIVFSRSSTPDVTSFNTLIGGYAQEGDLQSALFLFRHMQTKGIWYDKITFLSIVKACYICGNLQMGQHIHAQVVEFGVESNEHVGNSLLHMYVSSESFEDARVLFERMWSRSVVTWSTLIAGYTESGRGLDALSIFGQMREQGVQPNEVTYISILKGCSSIPALENGRSAHSDLIESGHEGSLCIGNALVDMYGKCGSLEDATALFLRMPSRNVITWTTLIAGYTLHDHAEEALLFFDIMQNEGFYPNPVTFAAVLKACSSRDALDQGRQIHAYVIEYGLEFDAYVGNSLVAMYFECNSSDDAIEVFGKMPERGVVTWNTLICGCVQSGRCFQGLQFYQQMVSERLVQPDSVTFVCVLKSCVGMADLNQGILIHAHIVYSNCLYDISVGSGLVEMYVKFGFLEDACRVFSSLPDQNVVTWNILLKGFAETGHVSKTLELFLLMQEDGIKPDAVTLLCTLKACSSMGAPQHGRLLHTQSVQRGLDIDLSVANSLISMYSSCGSMSEAQAVFDKLSTQDSISWSILITGYAQHNDCLEAIRCYKSMLQCGLKPDAITLVCLLSACSRGGLIDEGFTHFKSMRDSLGLQPTIEHYNPLVDLLGGMGALHEAEDLLETLPFKRNMVGWMTLLAASREYSDQGIAHRCFDHAVRIDPTNSAAYVIMSNVALCTGQLQAAQDVEELRKLANAWKKPAKAFIEIGGRVHEFVVGDKTHPQMDAIHAKLNCLNDRLKKEGYRPKQDPMQKFFVDEDKEKALCGHAEKLAIAFGMISSSPVTTLRVSKNLRMCDDCHVVTKLISRVETRNIVVKDAYCIHQFRRGSCSCERTSLDPGG